MPGSWDLPVNLYLMAATDDLDTREKLVTNALSLLRSGDPSTWSRIVASNTSTNGANRKRRGKAKAKGKTSILKTVMVDTRLQEFKNEPFRKSGGKLFCNACREELSTKASIIKSDIASSKHCDSFVREDTENSGTHQHLYFKMAGSLQAHGSVYTWWKCHFRYILHPPST